MTSETHESPLETAPAPAPPAPLPAAPPQRLTWREKRWQRRRRRRLFEEVLGWILVPIIVVACYWAVKAGLNAAGTSPSALIAGIRQLLTGGGAQP
ncbi:MAG TPA: hypothetical protein VKB16_10035 [Beijerinckiaceae bacterium]|nr:hypothetical protein [Beijerinckiaceae bacterium]